MKAENQDKQIEQSSERREKENVWRAVEEEEGKSDDKMLCSDRKEENGQESQAQPSNMDNLEAWAVSVTWHCGVPLSKSKRSEDVSEEQGQVSSHEEGKKAVWQLSHLDEKEKQHHDGIGS